MLRVHMGITRNDVHVFVEHHDLLRRLDDLHWKQSQIVIRGIPGGRQKAVGSSMPRLL